MPVLTAATWRARPRAASSEHSAPLVVCLCAAWCDTCSAFRVTFERIAETRPNITFLWLDIEDDAGMCGEIDVENFPTLAIWRADALVFYGASLPQEGSVARLIDAMAREEAPIADMPEVAELGERLRATRPV